jgi:hypothetical protein
VFTYTVSPLAKAYIFDTLGSDKDSTFTTDKTVVNASGLVKIKVVAEDGTFKYYDLVVKLVKSSLKQLTSFSIVSPATTGKIANGVVSVSVPKGTDVTKLVASFASSSFSKVYITKSNKDSLQTSGVTINNFSDTVSYKVVAEDGSNLVYKVVVTILKSQGNSITKFSFVDPAVTGVITGTNILIKVPKATDFTTLIATFEASVDAVVKVGNNVQVTGVTVNDFTSSVSYVVTSEAGVSQTYKVTVEEINTTGLNSVNSAKLLISPNPSTGVFSVKSESGVLVVNVVDVTGKSVYTYNDNTTGTHILDLTSMEAGIYVASITSNGVTETHKLQVIK